MKVAIRLTLSAILIYFVWTETGWATATAIGLFAIVNEMQSFAIRTLVAGLRRLAP